MECRRRQVGGRRSQGRDSRAGRKSNESSVSGCWCRSDATNADRRAGVLQAGVVVSGQEEEQEQRDDGWLSICGGQRMHAINSEWLTKQHSTAQHSTALAQHLQQSK